MRPHLLASLFVLALALPVSAQSALVGTWRGELAGTGLSAVLHVTEADGAFSSTLDVPEQGAEGIPTGETTLDDATVRVTIPAIGATFEGALDGDTIAGTWTQPGGTVPLVLTRVAPGETGRRVRDDDPVAPFPYTEEEVTVSSVEGVTLAGTLTSPNGAGPFPAVVLVAGSGPQDRDSDVFGHRLFVVLSDALARRGIASLRYDERGIGASTGTHSAATTADLALDAQAVTAFLDARPEARTVGLIGHSEGGAIAPLVANALPGVGFAVALAGPAISGRETLRYQLQRDLPLEAASPDVRASVDTGVTGLLDALAAGASPEDAARAFTRATEPLSDRSVLNGFDAARITAGLAQPWFRYFIGYDPAPTLRAMRVPLLAVFGALDQQVRASDNVPAAVEALATAPDGTRILVLPRANHLFQQTDTGSVSEYGTINSGYSTAVMDAVADWILDRTEP